VQDWSGGTRIGQCLKEFNFRWSRRVLAQGAHVLLMTDGLERDDTELLGARWPGSGVPPAHRVAQPAAAL
jgi:uncharacterized protein